MWLAARLVPSKEDKSLDSDQLPTAAARVRRFAKQKQLQEAHNLPLLSGPAVAPTCHELRSSYAAG
eukprot:12814394-Alexandrium_andersonii.AAC.1